MSSIGVREVTHVLPDSYDGEPGVTIGTGGVSSTTRVVMRIDSTFPNRSRDRPTMSWNPSPESVNGPV